MQWYVDRPQQITSMKQHARDVALERFDWASQEAEIVELFKHVSKRPEENALKQAILKFEARRDGLKTPSALYTNFHAWAYRRHPRFFAVCSAIMVFLKSLKPKESA